MTTSETLFWLGVGAFVLIGLIESVGRAPSGGPSQSNYVLPITQHADGHYYDAAGKFVS